MEKSRAIELLKLAVPIKALTQQEYADFVEAVNMGMDALEQPTSPDTIDRKAALDALRRCQTYLYDARDPELKIELSSAEAAINNLSTIQPENAQLSKEGTTKGTTSDLISRKAAIDAICESANDLQDVLIPVYYRKLIENLPSAQLEPPIIKCKDCKWWRKQKDSEQGRCGLLAFYPTGGWYCANGARERRTDE